MFFADRPYIISGLSNKTATEGNRVSFYCEAQGNPSLITYNWYKDKIKLLSSSGNYEITNNGRSLNVKSAGKGDIGQYKCTGTNVIGEGDGSVGYLAVKCKYLFKVFIFLSHIYFSCCLNF